MASLFPAYSIREVFKEVLLPRLTEDQAVDGKHSLQPVKMWFFFAIGKNGDTAFNPRTALNFVKPIGYRIICPVRTIHPCLLKHETPWITCTGFAFPDSPTTFQALPPE